MNGDSAVRETIGAGGFHLASVAPSPLQQSTYYQARSPETPGPALWFPNGRVLPDPAICRARVAGFGGHADCLVDDPFHCPHVLSFGFGFFCCHPERAEIVRSTSALGL
jgi:hypothetical protein